LEKFYKLFLDKLDFSYDSFDRIVINGYMGPFHNPSNLSYYFKKILGHGYVNKELLFSVTEKYKQQIEAYAGNHHLSCEYISNDIRKEKYVKKYRERFEKKDQFGVYYILKTKENESTFRVVSPNRDQADPENYLAKTRKPFTHYYFYIHDEVLGNMCIRVASYLPFKVTIYLNGHSYIERYLKKFGKKKGLYKKRENAFLNIQDIDLLLKAKEAFTPDLIRSRINHWLSVIGPGLESYPSAYQYFIDQIEYSRNFIFKSHFFLKSLFLRSCELSMHAISSDRIKEIFDARRSKGRVEKSIHRSEDGVHVFKAIFNRCVVKQYRKFLNFLRFEFTCNHLPDLKLKKALDELPEFEEKAEGVLDRYTQTEASMLNCHADIDYFKKHSQPVMMGKTKIPAVHVYQERTNRMLETLLHDHRSIGQWKSMELRSRIITEFELSDDSYSRNQVIYDIRKLRAHGLLEKLEGANRYRLTGYGVKVALAFTVMRKRIYGPMHYSLFHHQPDPAIDTSSKLERMYRQLDFKINDIQKYLAAHKAA
jgi:hypothetical protein